jgi:hypothetical protein
MVSAAQAGWEDRVSSYDAGRLAKLDAARAKALSEAESGRDIRLIRGLIDAEARPASLASLAGDWQCRTIKVGGMSPDVVYSWFRCRIGGRDGRLTFDKVSGTQRVSGRLYPRHSGGFVILAGLSTKGEPRHGYSGNGPAAGAATTPDDAVGLLEAIGPRSARIEFPYPVQESTLDIIELRR